MQNQPKMRVMPRTVGHIAARLDELPLGNVTDPRKGKTKLKMRTALTALTALITGIAAGCRGLGELEELTDWLGRGSRKLLRVWRRIPDTTLRDLIVKLDPEQIRTLIRHAMRQAHRRKQLEPDLPLRAASMDGSHIVTRRLYSTEQMAGYREWTHLNTVVRVQSERVGKNTGEVAFDDRYYLSSIATERLSADHWLLLICRRWSMENENHNTFDTVLDEDTRPWVLAPRGMVVVMRLRRLTYNSR